MKIESREEFVESFLSGSGFELNSRGELQRAGDEAGTDIFLENLIGCMSPRSREQIAKAQEELQEKMKDILSGAVREAAFWEGLPGPDPDMSSREIAASVLGHAASRPGGIITPDNPVISLLLKEMIDALPVPGRVNPDFLRACTESVLRLSPVPAPPDIEAVRDCLRRTGDSVYNACADVSALCITGTVLNLYHPVVMGALGYFENRHRETDPATAESFVCQLRESLARSPLACGLSLQELMENHAVRIRDLLFQREWGVIPGIGETGIAEPGAGEAGIAEAGAGEAGAAGYSPTIQWQGAESGAGEAGAAGYLPASLWREAEPGIGEAGIAGREEPSAPPAKSPRMEFTGSPLPGPSELPEEILACWASLEMEFGQSGGSGEGAANQASVPPGGAAMPVPGFVPADSSHQVQSVSDDIELTLDLRNCSGLYLDLTSVQGLELVGVESSEVEQEKTGSGGGTSAVRESQPPSPPVLAPVLVSVSAPVPPLVLAPVLASVPPLVLTPVSAPVPVPVLAPVSAPVPPLAEDEDAGEGSSSGVRESLPPQLPVSAPVEYRGAEEETSPKARGSLPLPLLPPLSTPVEYEIPKSSAARRAVEATVEKWGTLVPPACLWLLKVCLSARAAGMETEILPDGSVPALDAVCLELRGQFEAGGRTGDAEAVRRLLLEETARVSAENVHRAQPVLDMGFLHYMALYFLMEYIRKGEELPDMPGSLETFMWRTVPLLLDVRMLEHTNLVLSLTPLVQRVVSYFCFRQCGGTESDRELLEQAVLEYLQTRRITEIRPLLLDVVAEQAETIQKQMDGLASWNFGMHLSQKNATFYIRASDLLPAAQKRHPGEPGMLLYSMLYRAMFLPSRFRKVTARYYDSLLDDLDGLMVEQRHPETLATWDGLFAVRQPVMEAVMICVSREIASRDKSLNLALIHHMLYMLMSETPVTKARGTLLSTVRVLAEPVFAAMTAGGNRLEYCLSAPGMTLVENIPGRLAEAFRALPPQLMDKHGICRSFYDMCMVGRFHHNGQKAFAAPTERERSRAASNIRRMLFTLSGRNRPLYSFLSLLGSRAGFDGLVMQSVHMWKDRTDSPLREAAEMLSSGKARVEAGSVHWTRKGSELQLSHMYLFSCPVQNTLTGRQSWVQAARLKISMLVRLAPCAGGDLPVCEPPEVALWPACTFLQ